jgi:NitT/TauT family transport system permease protein
MMTVNPTPANFDERGFAGSGPNLDEELASHIRRTTRAQTLERVRVIVWQLLILIALLLVWETLTRIPWFVKNTIFDPFFVSRPSLIAVNLYSWTLGVKSGYLWPHLTSTVFATLIGLVLAVSTGFLAGLILSQRRTLAAVLTPYIVAANSLPRIAFVPLITMIFGLGLSSKVVTAWFIVFFLVFFNTFKGGVTIERHIIDFCRTLGASDRQITRTVRIPNTLAWAFASLPNAVAFSLIGVVISEFVGSDTGMGYIIITSLSTLNAADMWSAIIVLSVTGIALVVTFGAIERRLLRWSPEFRET